MKTIIAVQGPSDYGKTESITLAAKKCCATGARLIAKEFRRPKVEIVEVYEVNSSKGISHVAYISQGDVKELIERQLDVLDAFRNAATTTANLSDELKLVEIKYKRGTDVIVYHEKDYAIIDQILKYIGKKFQIDVIIIACHKDKGAHNSTYDAIHKYAYKNGYNEIVVSPFKIEHVETYGTDDSINEIAKANDACASYINSIVFNIL